ncbi:hypothetical protein, partial [Eubacterium aggregans]|uniref:hypothetical protein n=1 Tax=Eubacterium aggregans TaxID=81409 RepID=UPI003F372255
KADFKDLREEMLTSKYEELKLVEIQLPEENDTFPLPKDQKHVHKNQHHASEIEQHESVSSMADITQCMERLEKTIREVIMQMGKKYNAEFLILHKEINDLKEIARRDTNEEQKFE